MPNLLQNILLKYINQNIIIMFFIMFIKSNHILYKYELFYYLTLFIYHYMV